ncbi:MAG: type IV pilus assembly protein PilM [Nitriliruptor sp.]
MPSSAVGIDIGSRTITFAEVKRSRGSVIISNFGGIELPEDAVRDGEILDTEVVGQAMKELLASAKVRTKKVHLGVANQRVVVRQIDVPWLEPKELKASIRYQVQEYLPIPVEEAEIDVHPVDEFTSDNGERFQRLLLVAAHKDMVASHMEAAEAAGLRPASVDLNPFAALRALGRTTQMESGSEVVVDVGAGVTGIVVHDGGIPTFVRILVLGGDDITSALASGLGVPVAEAEAQKRQLAIGGDASDPASRIVTEQADQFVDEVRSSLDYYQDQPGSARLSNVVLTGGGSLLGGMADQLARAVRLPVEIGSVFDRFEAKDTIYGPEDLARVGPNLAVAVGIALGGLE